MNSKPSSMTTFVLIFGILTALTVWWTTDQQSSIDTDVQTSQTKKPKKILKRRTRTGPRTPPPAVTSTPSENGEKHDDNKQISSELAPSNEAESSEQDEKRAEYLEHLDVLDNPNVDELTMLGEMAFDANDPEAAYEHYLEVIDHHTDHPLAPFALYKLAWAEYNLGDVDAAIADMELMLEWLDVGESPMADVLRAAGPTDLQTFTTQEK